MSDLWFARDPGATVSRLGTLLFAADPDGIRAVLTQELTYPDDPALESRELLGFYGSLVHGAGHQLLREGVGLPAELEHWSTAPNRPMAELGGWQPRLVPVDGSSRLFLGRDFDGVRAFASTWSGRHVIVLAPSSEAVPALETRSSG